jgi:hypothetical protein
MSAETMAEPVDFEAKYKMLEEDNEKLKTNYSEVWKSFFIFKTIFSNFIFVLVTKAGKASPPKSFYKRTTNSGLCESAYRTQGLVSSKDYSC